MEEQYVQHSGGAWWDQVNFIVHILGQYDEATLIREQVGVKRLDQNTVMLCSLPFYVYGLSLGDTLIMDPSTFKILGIKSKSGRSLFRIMFKCERHQIVSIAKQLSDDFEAIFEWKSKDFCSIDVNSHELSNLCCAKLDDYEKSGFLEYEVGISSSYGPIFPS